MRKIIYISAILLLTSLSSIGQEQYYQAMGSALGLWGQGKSNEASAAFERISQVEKKNWLPTYYVALINILDGFKEKDRTIITQKLEKSEQYIKLSKQRKGNTAELSCLEGLINTVMIMQDPMNNGQNLSPKTIAIYKKAIQLEPNNPRPLYLLAQFQINSAQITGGNCTTFYKMIEKAIKLFDTFKAQEAFYPNWGKQQAESLLNNMKKDE